MYQYIWDEETGGYILTSERLKFSKEPRPVYYKELDILGFDKYWNYPKDDSAPFMWAEANNYIYRGRLVAKTKGGSLYTKPEIVILDEPEPIGEPLRFVDIDAMCRKNSDIMETLVQETIRNIYNTYKKYKKKIDVFYVAFSGGKDSTVILDLVQRALPHDEFKVIFGDTQMEFPDTYEAVRKTKDLCDELNIDFLEARSEKKPSETWRLFGPPSTTNRWCCSVHKTAPQILLLRKIINKANFTGMAFVGVRTYESLTRSTYSYISYAGKHKGQYSCNAILDWSSSEVFLYIFANNLIMNKTYLKGNRRAGCLICPGASDRNDFMNHYCYADKAEEFVDIIREAYRHNFSSDKYSEIFIDKGGWKARKNGRDLNININYEEDKNDNYILILLKKTNTFWKEWIKTIGILLNDSSPYTINYKGSTYSFIVEESNNKTKIFLNKEIEKINPEFVKHLKFIFRRAAYCVACRECQADCPFGYMDFQNGDVIISDKCHHCSECHKIDKGCLVYKSLSQPKGGIIVSGKKMSLNCYSHHAPKTDWIKQYFEYKNNFNDNHTLGSNMYAFFKRFLRDSKLLDGTGFSSTAMLIEKLGIFSEQSWGIIYTNLCYTPQIFWFVTNTTFNITYSTSYLVSLMIDAGAKENWTGDILNSLSRLTELPLGKIGLGNFHKEKNKNVSIIRSPWSSPDPRVILYSLFKFAEGCGDYYQFSLSDLLDDTIERDGVSPTRIFGLTREVMVPLLNGLSSNYSDFISVSFTHDLETITLKSNKKSEDVLSLF